MSSSFHNDVQRLRHELLSRLIRQIAGVQEHEENFAIAYEFCDQNLKHHRFLDVNPRQVDSKYEDLQARFRTNSMHSSADRLQQLHRRLCALKLKGRYEDLNHSILQLLICLAGKPVDPSHVVASLTMRATSSSPDAPASPQPSLHAPEQEIQSDSSSSVYDPWEDKSDLSSWDEDEMYEGEDGARRDEKQEVKWYSDSVPDLHERNARDLLSASALGKPLFIDAVLSSSVIQEHTRLEPPAEGVPPRLTTCSPQQLAYVLAGQKLHAITGKHTPMTLNCFTDSYVVLEVVQLLKGLPSELFTWDAQTQSYTPKPNILLPYLSPGCVADMLKRFGQVAVRVTWLQTLVQNLSELSSVQHYTDAYQEEGAETEGNQRYLLFGEHRVVMSAGLSALGESIRRQLHLALQPFLQLESSVLAHAAQEQQHASVNHKTDPPLSADNGGVRDTKLKGEDGRLNGLGGESANKSLGLGPQLPAEQLPPHSASPLNLLTLSQLVTSFSSRLLILQQAVLEVLRSCVQADQLPAAVTSAVVDSLVLQVQQWEQQGGPRGRLGQCSTLHLLLSCLRPMLDSLQGWMFGGLADMQLQRDFFIKQVKALSAKDPSFWGGAYTLQRRADGSVASPAFLTPLVEGILACGKALRLLHEMEFDRAREYHAWLASSSVSAPHLALTSHLNTDVMTPLGLGVRSAWRGNLDMWAHVELFGVVMHSVKELLQDYEHPQHPSSDTADRVVGANSFFQRMAEAGEAAASPGALPADLLGWMPPWTPPPSSADNVVPPMEQGLDFPPATPAKKADGDSFSDTDSKPITKATPGSATKTAQNAATQSGHVGSAGKWKASSAGQLGLREQERVRQESPGEKKMSGSGQGVDPSVGPRQYSQDALQGGRLHAAVDQEEGGQAAGHRMRESGSVTAQDMADPEPMDVDEAVGVESKVPEMSEQAGPGSKLNRLDGSEGEREDEEPQQDNALDGKFSKQDLNGHQPSVNQQREPSRQQQLTDWLTGVRRRLRGQEEVMQSQWATVRAEAMRSCRQGPGGVAGQSGAGKWLSHQLQGAEQLDWLLDAPNVEVPPVELVLQDCMVAHLQDRVEEVGQQLLSQLLSDWGLMAELEALRNVFLVGGPTMNEWVQRLLVKMFRGVQLVDLHDYELEGWMQEAFAQARPDEVLPPIDELNVNINPPAKGERRWSTINPTSSTRSVPQLERSVTELEGLVVRYNSSWLLSMITDASVLQQYNQVLVFLLQVRWAKVALDDVKQRSWSLRKALHGRRLGSERDGRLSGVWRQGRPVRASTKAPHRYSIGKKDQATLMEMTHFVTNLQHFITDQLLSSAWTQLTQTLQTARTLDDVRTAHSTFLEALMRQCCLSGKGGTAATWKHVGLSMRKMLDCVLQFCAALGQVMLAENVGDDPELVQLGGILGLGSKLLEKVGVTELRQRMGAAAEEFHRKCVYMMKVLATKTLKIGGDAELEYLIMRLNYNGVYNKELGPELAWNGK